MGSWPYCFEVLLIYMLMSVAVCVQLKEFVSLDELRYSGGDGMEIIMRWRSYNVCLLMFSKIW
jgi:hypothetical protein